MHVRVQAFSLDQQQHSSHGLGTREAHGGSATNDALLPYNTCPIFASLELLKVRLLQHTVLLWASNFSIFASYSRKLSANVEEDGAASYSSQVLLLRPKLFSLNFI